MIGTWLNFVLDTAVAVIALVSLFEGTRQLALYGTRRAPIFMVAAGAVLCIAYGAFHYWKHTGLIQIAQPLKHLTEDLPNGWGADLKPEIRESNSLALAKVAFYESGALRFYFGASGERKLFAPSQEDLKQRELRVKTYTLLVEAIKQNYGQAWIWWVSGLIAALLGFALSYEKLPLPANSTAESDARKSSARGSL
jgi:hypothetical protein